MTVWIFLACALGSMVGTVTAVFVALAILLWLDTPVRRSQPTQLEDDFRIHF